MNDPTKISDVHIGVSTKISLLSSSNEFSEGVVYKVLSEKDDPKGVIVILENGKKGHVIQIVNSAEIIKRRILSENQYSENKEVFGAPVMKTKVIPQTIQSFLNSEGGYLYIGIKDTGTLEERLVGLTFDREIIENGRRAKDWLERERKEKLPDEKFEDFLEMDLMTVLTKYLASDEPIAPLLETNFPEIDGVKILEIHIAKSPKPFFFKNLLSDGREIKFNIKFNNESFGQRFLDNFYIRRGGSKIMLEKNQDFYDYAKNRFQKP
jgi:predicted HTH transcriptional regulator